MKGLFVGLAAFVAYELICIYVIDNWRDNTVLLIIGPYFAVVVAMIAQPSKEDV
jgi:hypothetical protein